MINPNLVQEALIQTMKGSDAIRSRFGEEIREDNWMGTNFSYPALRLSLDTMGPYDRINGPCRPRSSDIQFSALVYTEGPSSNEAGELAGIVANELMGKLIDYTSSDGKRIIPVGAIDIPAGGIMPPVPDNGERSWRAEVRFNAKIMEGV